MSILLKFINRKFLLSIFKLVKNYIIGRDTKYPKYLIDFENNLANYFNFKFCLTFSNGTSAADSIIKSFDVNKKFVIVSKLTFPSIICNLLRNGANLYYFDVDFDLNLVIKNSEDKINNSEFILITSAYGFKNNKKIIEKIKSINPKIKIIEDMSHSQGASNSYLDHETNIDGGFMSLQGSKAISAGEGGVAFTNSEEIYKKMIIFSHLNRSIKNFDNETNQLTKIGIGVKSRMHPLGVFSAEFDLKELKSRNNKMRQKIKILYETLKKSKKLKIPEIKDFNHLGGFHYGLPFFAYDPTDLSFAIQKKYHVLKYNWPALDKIDYFHSSEEFKKINVLDTKLTKVFLKTGDIRDQLYFIDLKFLQKNNDNSIKNKIENFINEI